MKKLVVISHTEHQINAEQRVIGWGPTVREINYLAQHWEQVVHVACLKQKDSSGSYIPYESNNIIFSPIPDFGGPTFLDKLFVIFKLPLIIYTVHKSLADATEVQLRLPMSIGLFLVPYFVFRKRDFKLWVKYATNWGKPSKSLTYRIQHKWLKSNLLNCSVTINGFWPNQGKHCKTFENPCLTVEQYNAGNEAVKAKSISHPFTFIFVGHFHFMKGVDLLLDAISEFPNNTISMFHLVGDGPLLESLKLRLSDVNIPFTCHGFITQVEIFKLLPKCHFLLLPSRSEGFPKVVAEALNFGCLPIVSDVGSVSHYIKEDYTGFLIKERTSKSISDAIIRATEINPETHQKMLFNGRDVASYFTFESYFYKLSKEVLSVF